MTPQSPPAGDTELDVVINGQRYILPFERDAVYAKGYKQGQKDMNEIHVAAQARFGAREGNDNGNN